MARLAVESLQLSYFRSHKSLTLELDQRPVVLHGANGVGKTNVLEALSLLSPGRGLRRAKGEQLARQPDSLGWKVSARVSNGEVSHLIETGSQAGSARNVKIDGKTKPQLALGSLVPVVWLVPAMDRLWTESAEGRRRFLDRLTLNFFPEHGRNVLSYEKAMRDRNRLLKDGVTDPHWYDALEARMAEAGERIALQRSETLRRIEEAQAKCNDAFPDGDLALIGPEGDEILATDPHIRAALQDGRQRDLLAGRTLSGPHRDDLIAVYATKGIPAKDCSTGEQKALLISLILAVVRSLKNEHTAPPLVLLDEISAHLDRDRQNTLYDEICALGTQAWMTGTEQHLFDGLASRAQFIEIRNLSG
ncbi:MAG: DNA replication/repair protein RecF [Pseudomonadota bacterium]